MTGAEVVGGYEAIRKISDLLQKLLNIRKDAQAAQIVGEVNAILDGLRKETMEAREALLAAQREHIQLERKLAAMERESAETAKQMEANHMQSMKGWEAQLAALQGQIAELKAHKQAPSQASLPEPQKKILIALFKQGGSFVEADILHQFIGIDLGMFQYHINELQNKKLIRRPTVSYVGSGASFAITGTGQKLVVDSGLVG